MLPVLLDDPSGLTGPIADFIRVLAVDSTNSSTVYAGTSGGVFKCTNGGVNWSATGLSANYVWALVIDSTGTDLYAGAWGGGVFKSTGGGVAPTVTGAPLEVAGKQGDAQAMVSFMIPCFRQGTPHHFLPGDLKP